MATPETDMAEVRRQSDLVLANMIERMLKDSQRADRFGWLPAVAVIVCTVSWMITLTVLVVTVLGHSGCRVG